MAGSVEFACSGGSPNMSRSWTTAFTAFSGFIRIKNTANAGTYGVATTVGDATDPWLLYFNEGGGGDLRLYTGSFNDAVNAASSAGTWIDVCWRPNGSTTDVYWKLASGSTWNGPLQQGIATFSPTTIGIGQWDLDHPSSTGTMRIGKIVYWNAAKSVAEIQGEAAARALVTSANAWFYSACTATASVATDASGAGNNFTLTGTPTDVADDPGFPAATSRAQLILPARPGVFNRTVPPFWPPSSVGSFANAASLQASAATLNAGASVTGTLVGTGALGASLGGGATVSGTLTQPAAASLGPSTTPVTVPGVWSRNLPPFWPPSSVGSFANAAMGPLSATLACSASLSATITGLGALAATCAGGATVTATTTGLGALGASLAGGATLSGTDTGLGTLSASLAAGAAATGTLAGKGALAATLTGGASIAATLALSANCIGSASVSATITGAGALGASCTGGATLTGTATGLGSLGATLSTSASLTGNLVPSGSSTASLTAGASLSGTLAGIGVLGASCAAGASLTGGLTGLGTLGATLSASATLSGTAAALGTLTTSLTAGATCSGTITGKGALAASLSGGASTTGNLTPSGSSTANLTGGAALAGTLIGLGAVGAVLSGGAVVTAGVTGTGNLLVALACGGSCSGNVVAGSPSAGLGGSASCFGGLTGIGSLGAGLACGAVLVARPGFPFSSAPLPRCTAIIDGTGIGRNTQIIKVG